MKNKKEFPTMPDWADAPDWANWRCIDSIGDFEYHELEPDRTESFWISDGRETIAGFYYDATNWENSLQKRPE